MRRESSHSPNRIFLLVALLSLLALGLVIVTKPDDSTELPSDDSQDEALLEKLRQAAIHFSDPERHFEGITYTGPEDAWFSSDVSDWLMQIPEERYWGSSVSEIPYFNVSAITSTGDFALPSCEIDLDCAQYSPTGAYGYCRQLAMFNNGLNTTYVDRCIGHSDAQLEKIYNAIVQAEHDVTLLTLMPMPDVRFLSAIRNALTVLAKLNKPVTVRLLQGLYPPGLTDEAPPLADADYLRLLVRDIQTHYPDSRLKIYVGSELSCFDFLTGCGNHNASLIDRTSLNHIKAIVVDGETLIMGGENLRTGEYLEWAPVHDVSLVYRSRAVGRAVLQVANTIWRFICSGEASVSMGQAGTSMMYESGDIKPGCLAQLPVLPAPVEPPASSAVIKAKVMGAGRLGLGLFNGTMPANQDDVIRTYAFSNAKQSIFIVQQDLGINILGENFWLEDNPAGNIMTAIADLLFRQGDVHIVLSNYDAKRAVRGYEQKVGDTYSNGVKLTEVADELKSRLLAINTQHHSPYSESQINNLLCTHLYLAPLRFGPDDRWAPGYEITLHAKVWMVDGVMFYVGSHNLYPSNLQEYGTIIANAKLTQEFSDHYLNRIWQESRRVAISGDDLHSSTNCYFLR